MSFVERFIIIQCPYLGGSTIGGTTVLILLVPHKLKRPSQNSGQSIQTLFSPASLDAGMHALTIKSD